MTGLICFSCSDPRVPNGRVARALEGALMPKPGVEFEPSLDFVRFYTEKYGATTPCIILPHRGRCLAWANRGGDDAGFEHALVLSAYMWSHGVPSAALGIFDGQPPILLHDGLSSSGRSDILGRIQELATDPAFDWSFQHDVRVQSVNFGHIFRGRVRDVLRFASYAVTGTTIGVVRSVIEHYGRGEPLPVYFSAELSSYRRGEITRLLRQQDAPVILPV